MYSGELLRSHAFARSHENGNHGMHACTIYIGTKGRYYKRWDVYDEVNRHWISPKFK